MKPHIDQDDKRVTGPPGDDAAPGTRASILVDTPGSHPDPLQVLHASDRQLSERAALLDEAMAQSLTVTTVEREKAAHAREDAVHLREVAASLREHDLETAETKQAISNDRMAMLLRANENLVVTTIEAHALAEQLQATQALLEHAKLVAEKANLAKSNFLSSMSHELRTPLHAILGFAQLLERGAPAPTPTQIDRLQQITSAGWYLLELINEILDLAVIESGKLALSLEPVLLINIMRECEAMIEPQLVERSIRISFHECGSDWHVHADRVRLKQALINLLTNAIKYNREQGTVEVRCSLPGPERVRISVKDSGEGLTPHKLAQLFEPFNRLGQEGGAVEGTGIGLVVTRQLVQLMGGVIGVESTVGVGSEFWIELNVAEMPRPESDTILTADRAPQTWGNTAPRMLLYVEDNRANLMLVEHIIENHPELRMLGAYDANQGIALARTHMPDVILMDINLPGMSGLDALKVLRDDPATAHIPVIALSADAMPDNIANGLEAGFLYYLTKPIKVSAFTEALDKALAFSDTQLDGPAQPDHKA